MRTSGWQLCVIAASVFCTAALADFEVSSARTRRSNLNSEYANFAKTWTLTSPDATEIESLDLSLSGTVYVSYKSDIPSDVVGYITVTGNTRSVVEAISVRNEINGYLPDVTSFDDVFGDTKKQLSVSLDSSVNHGYLLTEIFLSTRRKVVKVATRHTADVIINKDVLLSSSATRGQTISVTGLSTLFVSMPDTDVKVRELDVLVTGGGRMQYRAKSLYLWQKLELDASGDTSIKLLCHTVIAGKLELEAETQDSEICLSADYVKTAFPDVSGKQLISMPNSGDVYGTRGTSTCLMSKPPPREPVQFTPVPKRKQQALNDADASAAAMEREEEKKDKAGSGDMRKDLDAFKSLVSAYNETDVAADEESYATDDKDTGSGKDIQSQGNFLETSYNDVKNSLNESVNSAMNQTMNIIDNGKDALLGDAMNETMNAIDNGKDALVGETKKAFNDATGNIFSGGSMAGASGKNLLGI